MKKLFLSLIVFSVSMGMGYAQDFAPFKVGLGVGYAMPGAGEGAGGGLLFYAEPGYRASDMFLIGLRIEAAIITRGVTGVGADDFKGDASTNTSFTLNGQYYFNDNYVRPFIGAGLGLYSLASTKFNTAGDNDLDANEVKAETVFGFYPRIGLDAGHFNLSIDYNFVPTTDVAGFGTVENNYLAIRAGVSIGGGVGRKKGE